MLFRSTVFVVTLFLGRSKRSKQKKGSVYLSGVSLDEGGRRYRNSLSGESVATARNLYLEDVFGEGRFKLVGEATCSAVIVFALGWSSLIVMPLL